MVFTSSTREDVTHGYLICVEAPIQNPQSIFNNYWFYTKLGSNYVRYQVGGTIKGGFPDNVMSDKDFNYTNDASQLESKFLPKLIIFINHTKLSVIQSVLRLNYLLNSKYLILIKGVPLYLKCLP